MSRGNVDTHYTLSKDLYMEGRTFRKIDNADRPGVYSLVKGKHFIQGVWRDEMGEKHVRDFKVIDTELVELGIIPDTSLDLGLMGGGYKKRRLRKSSRRRKSIKRKRKSTKRKSTKKRRKNTRRRRR